MGDFFKKFWPAPWTRITSGFNMRSRTIIPETLLFADTHRCPWEANGFLSYCATQKAHPLDQYLSWENIPGGLNKGSALSQAAHHGLGAGWGQDLRRPSFPQITAPQTAASQATAPQPPQSHRLALSHRCLFACW